MSEYEHRLVYFGEVDAALSDGWEPAPGMSNVVRYVGSHALTYVWLRRPVPPHNRQGEAA